MKKRKTYEVSVINKTYSKTYLDQTKFYTSDTALELNFQLKEVEYNFDSAEIILLNVDDRSLVNRPVVKSAEGFIYELEDDIVAHYGEWKGQLKFNDGGEIYVSSPVSFRIENDLSNDRPPKMSDVVSWENLKKYANSLVVDLEQAISKATEDFDSVSSTIILNESSRQENEIARQNDELVRVENEKQRNLTSVDEFTKLQDSIGGRNILLNGDISSVNMATFDITNYPEIRFKPVSGAMTARIRIRNEIFKIGETYAISFTIQNSEGQGGIYSLGGHSDGFEIISITMDGKSYGNDWSSGSLKTDFGYSEHNIVVICKFKGTSSDNNFYIQPNRLGSVFTMYDTIIKNFKIEKGYQATPYTKAPEEYTVVSKDEYYKHIKMMSDHRDKQLIELKTAITALGGA